MGMSAFEVVPEETISRELCGAMHIIRTQHTHCDKSLYAEWDDHFNK